MNPLDFEHHFFGRKETLQLLKKRVLDLKEGYRHNIAFTGHRYIGKTAVLQEFLYNLDDNKVTPIYFDLDHKDIFYFFHKFSASMLYHYLKNKQLPHHDDLNLLIEEAKRFIPHTVDVIKNIQLNLGKGKLANSFLGLMALPEIYTNESGQFCVLIFDEFQALEEFGIPDVFASLGAKIMTQKKCLYILSSSYKYTAQKILAEKLSLLFGNFESVELEAFDIHTSREFTANLLEGSKMDQNLANFLTEFTGGYPLYLQLICKELTNLKVLHQQNEIFLPLVAQSIENLLFDRWGVISRHFELIINDWCSGKGNKVISNILIAISMGIQKAEDLLDEVDINKTQLNQKLVKLQDEGIIFKNGKLFYFKDKLFKYWVKFVYQKRLNGIELTPDRQRIQFRSEFHNYVDQFQATAGKDFYSRIIELLGCFENETIDLNGRKYMLPTFRDITSEKLRINQDFFADIIKADTENSTWLIVLKKDSFLENDIVSIIEKARKSSKKIEKCLIISLSKPDDHAKLKALQERFWIWNAEEINMLLNLFDKPYILT
ncbi:MAG: AAA family ATPase [Candidatus Omnitrophica bacterium]|nr:AAA family ATPase [Candidatus Omnitrophota bacterium]